MQNTSCDYVNSLPLVLPLPSQREQTIVYSCYSDIISDVMSLECMGVAFIFFFFCEVLQWYKTNYNIGIHLTLYHLLVWIDLLRLNWIGI